jgi:hypothetical protein
MLFKPELITRILSRQKTETRRPCKPEEVWVGPSIDDIRLVRHNDRVKWALGQTYALQPGRGKPGIGRRILLTNIRRERLAEITVWGAKREGFSNRSEFFDYWDRLNPKGDANPEVWVLGFRLMPPK